MLPNLSIFKFFTFFPRFFPDSDIPLGEKPDRFDGVLPFLIKGHTAMSFFCQERGAEIFFKILLRRSKNFPETIRPFLPNAREAEKN